MQNGRFRIKYTAISAELKAHDFFAHLQYLKEYFHLTGLSGRCSNDEPENTTFLEKKKAHVLIRIVATPTFFTEP